MVRAPQRGLSLVELLTALVILSVLISLAAPYFSRMLTEQRLRQVSNELRISVVTARAEAIKRGETVAVRPRAQNWSAGWCVEPNAGAGACGDSVIQEFVSSDTIAVVTGDPITFNGWGRATGCPQLALSASMQEGLCEVCLSVTTDGRVVTAPGLCSGSCPGASNDMAWAGACP
ncbi:MAG: prepilin-type N-terminal cleavage/methylation domain-containing protein [Gammaproteobacteria bacterium]|jgi:prepilin-type N-terminal cleavage/methylation domain-containing protein|nr:prepilin-type N-terminal cleavage/methylation domain-containing protein [Gammaproteobacteria bacterium]